jgi:hypothetical protein
LMEPVLGSSLTRGGKWDRVGVECGFLGTTDEHR